MNADGLTGMANPTTCLPRIRAQPGAVELFLALCHLADLYSPQSLTHKDCLLRAELTRKPRNADNDAFLDALDAARADENEKRFAMSWLTRLIGSGLDWVEEDDGAPELSVDALLDLAGRVLGGHAALEEAGAICREFAFPLAEPVQIPGALPTATEALEPGTLKVTLRDDALPPSTSLGEKGLDQSETAAAAVGVQTWGSAVVFSDIFTRHPGLFHTDLETGAQQKLGVLELGAGTGLVGTVAARYLEHNGVPAEVVLSDYHDQVLDNLRYNIGQNFAEPTSTVLPKAEKLDWFEIHQERLQGVHVERKRYDLLLLADVVYAPDHAVWIHSSVQALLKKPSSEDDRNEARAHIIMAVRPSGKHEGLFHTVDAVFGAPRSTLPSLISSLSATPHDTMPGTPSFLPTSLGPKDREDQHSTLLHSRITALHHAHSQPQLCILTKRWLEKRPGIGRQDEHGYLWFEVGWTF